MNFIARDYTETTVGPGTYLIFNIWSLLSIVIGLFGLSALLKKSNTARTRMIGAVVTVGGGLIAWLKYQSNPEMNPISPEIFQHFNPTMIVLLTPLVVGLFAWLRKSNAEPSAPRKIGIGMIITAVGFVILLIGSLGLDPFSQLGPESSRVSSYWLISTYFTLTLAELFLSPMGISFVSKVSPPKYQGLMQGGWLLATALGNQMLWIGSYFYERIPIWQVWSIFIVLCLIAATLIFSVMRKLEKVSQK